MRAAALAVLLLAVPVVAHGYCDSVCLLECRTDICFSSQPDGSTLTAVSRDCSSPCEAATPQPTTRAACRADVRRAHAALRAAIGRTRREALAACAALPRRSSDGGD